MTEYHFTYGADHRYPKAYTTISGDGLTENRARDIQIAMHGRDWCGCYDNDAYWQGLLDKYGWECAVRTDVS